MHHKIIILFGRFEVGRPTNQVLLTADCHARTPNAETLIVKVKKCLREFSLTPAGKALDWPDDFNVGDLSAMDFQNKQFQEICREHAVCNLAVVAVNDVRYFDEVLVTVDTDTDILCHKCKRIADNDEGIACTQCHFMFCDNCYDTGKGDGCKCHN